ncbi:c-type cytochrome [Microvirga pakistanensis]|uniref:c-type cytochrome n=1 Tax=Microvirga pakistanensis TaxID=1682650 RepID=UPI00195ACDC9|nr:c-type cytochrome [Microvirga pakistanensis]
MEMQHLSLSIGGMGIRKCAAALFLFAVGACNESEVPAEQRVVGGDPERGRTIIDTVECGVCHIIPGVAGAHGIVGPSLEKFGHRQLVGGVAPNHPAILTRWVKDAPEIAPNTGMPSLPLTEDEARHVAAYLYTLR